MKFKNIYKVFAILVLFVTLQSRSNGPGTVAGLQVTGAPGSSGNNGTCGNTGCHAAGAFMPSLSIKLLDGSDAVTAYEAGKAYTLQVNIAASTGNPVRYGFQAVSLDDSDAQSGAWGTLGSGQQEVTFGGRAYIEHDTPSASGTFEMEWVAPADQGTGDITFYSAGIASNNNGSTAGDGVASSTLTVSEAIIDNVHAIDKAMAELKVLPNPVHETLNLQINSLVAGDFSIRVLDAAGRLVENSQAQVQVGKQVNQVDVSHLQAGMYIVQLYGEGHLAAVQMLKK